MSEMTRAEHLAWCKRRALEYCDQNRPQDALASMMSDMSKHPETRSPSLDQMTIGLMVIGALSTVEQVRRHINGYN